MGWFHRRRWFTRVTRRVPRALSAQDWTYGLREVFHPDTITVLIRTLQYMCRFPFPPTASPLCAHSISAFDIPHSLSPPLFNTLHPTQKDSTSIYAQLFLFSLQSPLQTHTALAVPVSIRIALAQQEPSCSQWRISSADEPEHRVGCLPLFRYFYFFHSMLSPFTTPIVQFVTGWQFICRLIVQKASGARP